MGNRVYEQMVTVLTTRWRVRGWLRFKDGCSEEHLILQQSRFERSVLDREEKSPSRMVRSLLDELDFASAVECVDAAGNGVCGYADWP